MTTNTNSTQQPTQSASSASTSSPYRKENAHWFADTPPSSDIQPIVDRVLSDPSVSRSGSATLPSGESVTYTYVPMTGGAHGSGGNKQGGVDPHSGFKTPGALTV
ncbi:hypothetical protein I350_04688 [Cryptococcus amylolentus CBS 6273]|uniref:Uncharacterized protein n=1 Tax=Cryptococcus amylolentus CBS 6273 TaxID=1296118 RepID=A0A1E3JXP8_9TREE|nr:hypothetical protein I350_04688 [Cryptococcus amylolentus CBS 6273]